MRGAWLRTTCAAIVASLVCATPSAAAPAFPYADSAWTWGTPRPQGEPLDRVDFHGSFGIAFTDEDLTYAHDDVLLSRDGGRTWAPGTLPGVTTGAELLPNGSIVGGGANCTLVRSDDGGRTFRPLGLAPSPGPSFPAEGPCRPGDVSFPTPDVGYVQRANTMMRTTDGGASFTPRTPVEGGLTFVGPDTGFALSTNAIARTTDGARTWRPVVKSSAELTGLAFPDPAHGYATGDRGTVLRTSDGGATWNRIAIPGFPGAFREIRCASRDACLAVYEAPPGGRAEPRLVRIENGGSTARLVPGLGGVRAVAYANGQRAVAVGDGGLMAYSNDAGATFRETTDGAHDDYFKVFPGPGRSVFAGGSDVGRSDNGGRTWRRLSIPRQRELEVEDLSFGDRQRGAVLFSDTVVSKWALWTTGDGGRSWKRRQYVRDGYAPSRIVALPNGRLITDIDRRGVWVSHDLGRHFRRVRAPQVRGLRSVEFARRGPLVAAYGNRMLAVTRDGTSWRRVPLPKGVEPGPVELVSRRVILVAASGGLWRTDDGGRHWREFHGTGAFSPVSMSFADARHGMMLGSSTALTPGGGNSNTVLRTDDGGRTWRPQFDDYRQHGSVLALDRSRVVLGGPGVLWSGHGGEPPRRRSIHLAIASRRGNVVRVRGRVTRPRTAERVLISRVTSGYPRARLVPVTRDGRFRLDLRLRRSSWLMAQAVGDRKVSGAGSKPVYARATRRAAPAR